MSAELKPVARNEGKKTEKRALRKIGAQQQPASGALPGIPNDGVKGRYLIEVKSTVRGSISLKREWLEDLDENALLRNKTGAFLFVFERGEWWVAIPLSKFESLTNEWKK